MSDISATRAISSKADIVQVLNEASSQATLKVFLSKLHDICFERCIPSPASSLSRNDEACIANCVRKFRNVHDIVGKEWNNELKKAEGL